MHTMCVVYVCAYACVEHVIPFMLDLLKSVCSVYLCVCTCMYMNDYMYMYTRIYCTHHLHDLQMLSTCTHASFVST